MEGEDTSHGGGTKESNHGLYRFVTLADKTASVKKKKNHSANKLVIFL